MPGYDTADYNLIYVYSIDDSKHVDLLKIGKASLSSTLSPSQLTPNHPALNQAARLRINQETKTAMVDYNLEYTELAVKEITLRDGTKFLKPFIDTDVFPILYKSGYSSKKFMDSGKESEWFYVDLATAKKAIAAYKAGKETIDGKENDSSKKDEYPDIILRDEQEDCVSKTIEWFKTYPNVLWDCKMRFGKTVTAYELIRRMNEEGKFFKTIVITHRPAVEDGWDSDHDLIFKGREKHLFIDKTNGKIDYDGAIDAENDRKLGRAVASGKPFVYFASIQDLRGSKRVKVDGYNKNNAVFDMDWDLIIIDEAHEGTQTELGDAVITALKKPNTKILSLSGTPYNLLDEYEENKYTWTYVDEQRAKKTWDEKHPGEKNPYEDLPTMNIFTFDLASQLPDSYRFASEDAAFNFNEFFRTWTGDKEKDFREIPEGKHIGDFVHEDDVYRFLSLIAEENPDSNYPFSTDEYRDMFRHTFWIVPGVKEAKALSALIQRHPRFKDTYKVANIAGDGDEEEPYDEALALVRSCIASYDHTITISCGKLTTGVTVREWTAVLMLTGSSSTSASGYMQAIFRVQSPGSINGKQKKNCYVFDFAPDRTLKVIADVHKLTNKGKGGNERARQALGEFLNFCPVISYEGTEMKTYDVPELMKEIKKISIENAVKSGFDDDSIYKRDIIKGMTERDQNILNRLADVVVPQKKGKKKTTVVINQTGLTDEERKKAEAAEHKPKKKLTPEEKEALEKLKKEREEEAKIRDLLRAVSIRLPIFFYGVDADITKSIHLADFTQTVDEESWKEFMPKGLDKGLFLDILKYYDEDVIVGAGQRYRKLAKQADDLPPTLRAKRIVDILSKFKNPDKETVLTPWRVVNLHMGSTFGGYSFFDNDYKEEVDEPHLIDNGEPTTDVFLNEGAQILEINSKSGLYPLYMAYSLYMLNIKGEEKDVPFEEEKKIWHDTVQNHIFVLCKTKMARLITIRTLVGYTNAPTNTIYLTKLVDERMKDLPRFAKKITNPTTWGKEGERMKFDAVVGNPPYQLENSGDGNGKDPIYHLFIDLSKKVAVRGSLIHPGRFLFGAGKTPKDWNRKITHDKTFKIVKYYPNSRDIFPTVDIKGGIAISYFDNEKDFGEIGTFCIYPELNSIIDKVKAKGELPMSEIIYPRDLYRLTDELYREHPDFADREAKGHKYDVGSNVGELFPELFTEEKPNTDEPYARIYTKTKEGRKLLWVKEKYLKLPDNFKRFKVFFAKIYGIGRMGETFPDPAVGEPNMGCSATFLNIGNFATRFEAESAITYTKTKFARVLVSSVKVTPNSTKETWVNVPQQDFSPKSDIDWNRSISEIDRQLYTKYGLSQEEIDFIETNVKPMGVESEYQKEMKMDYDGLVNYLLKKYGPVKHDYFTDSSCSVKDNRISRADEGLVCHHVDEDKAIMLSNPQYAKKNPFDYQKAGRLIYCNVLEHLILHEKIVEGPRKLTANENEVPGIGGAMNFLVKQINDYFGGKEITQDYLAKEMSLIEKDFEDYVEVLQRLWAIISQSEDLSKMFKKEDLAKGWDGTIYPDILEAI